ncbi:5-methylcytosine restriction system specificity protein McrC [Leuconostoc falkenbergense]|uniref:5-methylcytosine restriction system specificity protein McrC n=1 Tax=Leuconostoc falkenbergense TaxID=2766470 RepID=UPI0024466F16|nr:hypothetical protein [Leuconostoc falkenbergense]MDG9744029.1 hypothetical protein [Leuconostoc falkenbergense]
MNIENIESDNNIIVVQEGEEKFFENFLKKNNIYWGKENKEQSVIVLSKSLVGVIATPIRKIEIKPKFKEVSLNHVMRLYLYIEGYNNSLDDELLDITNSSNFNGISEQFLSSLKQLLSRGLPKEYVLYDENSSYWKGHVNVVSSIKNSKLLRSNPVTTRYAHLTIDNSVNILIKAALRKLTKNSSDILAKRLLTYYEGVSDSEGSGEQLYVKIVFNTKNSYLKKICFWAKMILDELFIDTIPGNIGGESFLINFDMLFESFVRKIAIEIPEKNFSLWKQPRKMGEISLEGNNIGNRIFLPDLLYKESTSEISNDFKDEAYGVIDVKNKAYNQFKPADIYQISMYASLLNAKVALLVYPAFYERGNEVMFIDYKFAPIKYVSAVFVNIISNDSDIFLKSIELFKKRLLEIIEN